MHGESRLKTTYAVTPCGMKFYLWCAMFILCFNLLTGARTFAADETVFTRFYELGLKALYKTLLKLTIGVAILSVASIAFTLIFGGQKAVDRAKNIVIYSLIGLALIWLAPTIIVIAKTPFKELGSSLGQSIINPNVPSLAKNFDRVWNFLEGLVLPSAILGVVYGACCFFGMDILSNLALERQVEKGKKIIRYVAFAVAAFYTLPAIVKAAYIALYLRRWKPPVAEVPLASSAIIPIERRWGIVINHLLDHL